MLSVKKHSIYKSEACNIQDQYRPDFFMDGVESDIQYPIAKEKRTTEKNYSKAAYQSEKDI